MLIDSAYMSWAQIHGCPVNTWTVNDGATAQRLAKLGVATVMSDAPDEIMQLLGQTPPQR
jgi:glycerophosphoryl diester phosphodiesterase